MWSLAVVALRPVAGHAAHLAEGVEAEAVQDLGAHGPIDATIIAAPPSTKNAEQAREPEMHQTRKGQQWRFGIKAHVGTDQRGIAHSLVTTDAKAADIAPMHRLLNGPESEKFGDQAYWCETHRQDARARGEHAFRVVNHLWGFTKVPYRGLAKNHPIVHCLCLGRPQSAATMGALAAGNLRLVNEKLPQGTASPDSIRTKTRGPCLPQ